MKSGVTYEKGDVIGHRYEVFGTIGKGHFGIVYLVYCKETGSAYALKTFQDRYLEDPVERSRFYKEAQIWINVERHPYLVRAYFVDEISGRLYIAMEYIAPDIRGLNSLQDYLEHRPPDLVQILRWAIQFCYGVQHAYSKGIQCHRDIKPSNILISQDKTVKISDFGLGDTSSISGRQDPEDEIGHPRAHNVSTRVKAQVPGYLTHMPPERWSNRALCDQRGDIYSFGMTLFQMATRGKLPFVGRTQEEHDHGVVPELSTPISPMIQRCLKKEPRARYKTFSVLRRDLEPILKDLTGEVIRAPELNEFDESEWLNKASSLGNVKHFEAALKCYDNALGLNPKNAAAWGGKALIFSKLELFREAMPCYGKALELAPDDALIWLNKGNTLGAMGRIDEAIDCCDRVIEIDPDEPMAWSNKAGNLNSLRIYGEAVCCCERALKLDRRFFGAWINKATILKNLGQFADSVSCCEKAIEIDPLNVEGWICKALALCHQHDFAEANNCLDKALEIDPVHVRTLIYKGVALWNLGYFDEAINCNLRVIWINPRDAIAWHNQGIVLDSLGRHNEALKCFCKALRVNPHQPKTLIYKGMCLDDLGRYNEAVDCYDRVLEINPNEIKAWENKGISLQKLGLHEEARHCFDTAKKRSRR